MSPKRSRSDRLRGFGIQFGQLCIGVLREIQLTMRTEDESGLSSRDLDRRVCASPRSVAAPMMREKMAWCSQRGVALVNITMALFAQPGTTLMRPACNARIPARTTGAGCIIKQLQRGRDLLLRRCGESGVRHAGHSTVTVTPLRLSSR